MLKCFLTKVYSHMLTLILLKDVKEHELLNLTHFSDLVAFSQNLPFSKVRLIFKVYFNALKMENLNFFRYKYAYLPFLLGFVSCIRKETRPRRPRTINLTFKKKVCSGLKPSDPIFQ